MNRAESRAIQDRHAAFTLLELVVTVTVVGLLAAVAVPRFTSSLGTYALDGAVERVMADLRLARQQAMSTSVPQTVDFTPASHNYTLAGMSDPDHPGETYTVSLGTAPYSVTLVSATFDTDSSVTFNIYGVPDSGGTIVLQRGGVQQTITLDAETGEVTTP